MTAGERRSALRLCLYIRFFHQNYLHVLSLGFDLRCTFKEFPKKMFHENVQVHWLSEAEKNAYADWKPCGLPETCEADITKHEVRRV